jgi:Holliday junction resolvase RusA-like endonuclease
MPLPPDVSADAMMVDQTLCLQFFGEPPTQIRLRAWYNAMRRRIVMYDPSKTVKDAYKIILQAALAELGYHQGIVFQEARPLKVTCRFYVKDERKDIDNMLKFFLDVMEKFVYKNDSKVHMVVATKVKVTESENSAFRTEIDVEYLN